MASGDGSTHGATPSTPATPDDTDRTYVVDSSTSSTPSPSNPWTGLTTQARGNNLILGHDSATACVSAVDTALDRLRGVKGAIGNLYMTPAIGNPPTGNLPSGRQLSGVFDTQAGALQSSLERHEQVLEGMIDTFHAADKQYRGMDEKNAAGFNLTGNLDDKISASNPLPVGVYDDASHAGPLTNHNGDKIKRERYANFAQLPGVIVDDAGVANLKKDGTDVLQTMYDYSRHALGIGDPPGSHEHNTYSVTMSLEDSSSLDDDKFYELGKSINYLKVIGTAREWLMLRDQLDAGFTQMESALKAVVGGSDSSDTDKSWHGAGAAQAKQACANYLDSARAVLDSMTKTAAKLIFTGEWLNQFAITLPDMPGYWDMGGDHEDNLRDNFDDIYKPGMNASASNLPLIAAPIAATTGSTATIPPVNPAGDSALTGDSKALSDEVKNDVAAYLDGQLKDPNSGLGQLLADYKKYADTAAAAAGGHYGSSGAATGGSTGANIGGAAAKSAAAGQPTSLEQQILTRLDKLEAQAAQQPNSNYKVPTANPPGPLEQIAQPIQGRPTSPVDGQTQSGTGTGTAPGVTGNAGDPMYPASYNPYAAQQNQAELSALANIGQQVAGAFQQFTNLLAQEVQQLTPSIEQALDAAAHHDVMDHDAKGPGGHDHAGPDEPPRAQARMFPRDGLLDDTPIAAAEQAIDTATGGTGVEDDATMQVDATAEPSVDA
ncbi:hypothetical protein [Nocardia sp. NPDC004604]|uniref:hypothetical protein n=1 Tax=Nocardia sp. NPDC004604 TaxID=3157013 RepID=UPI0033AC0A1B